MARQNRSATFDGSGPYASAPSTGAGFGTDVKNGFSAPQANRRPTHDEIRKRAYELFCARKGQGGTPEEDWLRAERELSSRSSGRA